MVNVTVLPHYSCLSVCLSASAIVLSPNVCDKLCDEEFLYVLREFYYPLSLMNLFFKSPSD